MRRIVTGHDGPSESPGWGKAITNAVVGAGAQAEGYREFAASRFGSVSGVVIRVGAITGGGTITDLRAKLVSMAHSDVTDIDNVPDEAVVWDSGVIAAPPASATEGTAWYFDPRPFQGGLRLVYEYTLTGTISNTIVVAADLVGESGGKRM